MRNDVFAELLGVTKTPYNSGYLQSSAHGFLLSRTWQSRVIFHPRTGLQGTYPQLLQELVRSTNFLIGQYAQALLFTENQ